MKLAERTTRIASSPTMKVTATVDKLRRSGVEVIDFGAGEPDFSTPDPIKDAARYNAHSAITFVNNVTTPLLIQHGENDRRVPLMQAQKFYKALKDLGKTVEFEIFPRGGHVLSEPAQQREIMRRNLAWFQRWLKP